MINEQARIVCETSLDRSCIVDVVIFFSCFRVCSSAVFSFSVRCGTYGDREKVLACVYVEESS